MRKVRNPNNARSTKQASGSWLTWNGTPTTPQFGIDITPPPSPEEIAIHEVTPDDPLCAPGLTAEQPPQPFLDDAVKLLEVIPNPVPSALQLWIVFQFGELNKRLIRRQPISFGHSRVP